MRIGGTRSILVFHTIDKKDIGRTLRIGLSRKCDTVIVRTKGIRACIGTEANSWFARTWIELSRIAGLCTIGYITCSIVNGIGLQVYRNRFLSTCKPIESQTKGIDSSTNANTCGGGAGERCCAPVQTENKILSI